MEHIVSPLNFKNRIGMVPIYVFIVILISISICIGSAPPRNIIGLNLNKSDDSIIIAWETILHSIYGSSIGISHYIIHRGTTEYFIPSLSNQIGQNAGTSFTDTGALQTNQSYFYYVTAVSLDGTEALLPSNIGYKNRIPLTYDPEKSNKYWLSLPYSTNYTSASDLGGDAPNIVQVIRWDPSSQTEEIWDQISQTGINFSIVPGEAYGIVISGDTVLNLVGSHTPTNLNLTYNSDNFNTNWFSLPFPNAYDSASFLAQDIPDVTKIGKYDSNNNTYESWFLLDGLWMGDDFILNPGEGVLGVITDHTSWTPSLGHPNVSASIDVADGLKPLTINLTGTTEDKNGSIVDFQWDYEGDGTFDYQDGASPDTSFSYSSVGTYYPTLLVMDNDGFKDYDYRTVVVYGLDNEISVDEFNPSGAETAEFTYTISDDGLMTIKIYDKDDNLIRTLFTDQPVTAGQNQVSWDGKNDLGEAIADGTYYLNFARKSAQ